jgi:serine/threonine-protein kinase
MNRLVSSEAIPVGGLTPGSMIAGRYRVIGLLGRGGMGEVYRADDVKLGQTVALKFLPREVSADPVWRERFFGEVRVTRQLSHPNICRVYDIGDWNGRHFLSMEFVDGEDLASLLRRIGHLSNEKSLAIARQLAAGLAVAHERGVLHRDLKPANIMIDGHGRVRITDFGLAVGIASEHVEGEMAGTPAYMAPEQLAGKAASVRSDIYALGLVLYEVCCGKRAFTARTVAELRDQKELSTPPAPSAIRPDIDPLVDRLIVRCLERDPKARPGSVAQVAASLPGGDPLAAAIAAGETPSPELVAASGLKEGLAPAIAVVLLAVTAAGSFATVWLNERASVLAQVRPSKSPDAMVERARTVLAKAGYTDAAPYSVSGFYADDDVVRYVNATGTGTARATGFRELGAVRFFYRQSFSSFVGQGDPLLSVGIDPGSPLQREGDIDIHLDADGRLRSFAAMPRSSEPRASGPNWPDILREAGLDPDGWMSVAPATQPRFFVDTRVAWEGRLSSVGETLARVEATALDGRMVTFDIIGPWHSTSSRGAVTAGAAGTPGARLVTDLGWLGPLLGAILFLTGAVFARQNLRIGRGDRRGATRLAVFASAIAMAAQLFERNSTSPTTILGLALALASAIWVPYVAVEPYVRRRWPTMLVAWVRVLGGEIRDPLVGREVLVGCATGGAAAALTALNRVAAWQAGNPVALLVPNWHMLNGTSEFIGGVFGAFGAGLLLALFTLFVFFLFRVVVRSDSVALLLLVLVAGSNRLQGITSWAAIPVVIAAGVLRAFVLVRIGLVAAIVESFVALLLVGSPMTLQTSAWYASAGYVTLTIVGAMALFGFTTALGGRAPLQGAALDD